MLRFNRSFLMLVLAGFIGLALGQARPEAADLESSFRELVPAGWELADLLVEVQENYGTEVEPDVRTRFQATVVLQEDTYEAAGMLGEANLLRRVLVAGELRKFFGVAQSLRRLGEWETTFTLENDPTLNTGNVLDSFAGRRLVLGTTEEADYRQALEAEAETEAASEMARLVREERLRAQQRASEKEELAHELSLKEAEAQAARDAEVARIAQEQALAAAVREQEALDRATRETELDALHSELAELLAAELRVRLAAHWEIKDIEEVGLTRRGSYDEPEFVLSFNADLQLQEDAFTARDAEGGGQILEPLQTSGARQTLEGTVDASWSAGEWQLNFDFNNLDGFSAGLPIGYYPATAVVAGSDEETAYWQLVEQRAEEELERELAAVARQQQQEAAKHEAARTAAAQEAQLQAIELAARAAEFAAVEAALLESHDLNSQLAAFEHALDSGDDNLYWRAVEAALRSNQGFLTGRAIPLALASGNSRLVDLAIARTLFDGGGLQFTSTNSRVNVIVSELVIHENARVTASVTGQNNYTNHESQGGAADEMQCGPMTGSLQNGNLVLSNDICDLFVAPEGVSQLSARFLSRRNFSWDLTSPFPARQASE